MGVKKRGKLKPRSNGTSRPVLVAGVILGGVLLLGGGALILWNALAEKPVQAVAESPSPTPQQAQAVAAPASNAEAAKAPAETTSDSNVTAGYDPWFMISDFSAVIAVRLNQLLEHEAVMASPLDELGAQRGHDMVFARRIEQVIIAYRPTDDLSGLTSRPSVVDLQPLAFIRARAPILDVPEFLSHTPFSEAVPVEKGGRSYWESPALLRTTMIVKLDERTLGICFFEVPQGLDLLFAKKPVASPLREQISRVDPSAEVMVAFDLGRHLKSIDLMAESNADLPPDLASYVAAGKELRAGSVALALRGKDVLRFNLVSRTATAAERVENTARQLVASWPKAGLPEPGYIRAVAEFFDSMLKSLTVRREGDQVIVSTNPPQHGNSVKPASAPVPAQTQQAMALRPSKEKLKMIGLALHKYHDANQALPPLVSNKHHIDQAGRRLHGWRSHVLAELGESELAHKVDLTAPWSSPQNQPLAGRTPEPFVSEGVDPATGKTRFVILSGPATVWPEQSIDLLRIEDGLETTLLVVEVPVKNAVPWTSTHDIPFNPEYPFAGISSIPAEGLLVLCADGGVNLIPADLGANQFKALITPNGREKVHYSEVFEPAR